MRQDFLEMTKTAINPLRSFFTPHPHYGEIFHYTPCYVNVSVGNRVETRQQKTGLDLAVHI
jgi:hypothetical protein